MAAIGPTLPPHLSSKRKRSESESSEDGPAPPPGPKSNSTSPKRAAAIGPALLPTIEDQKTAKDTSAEPKRVIGPSLPPASLDELPPDAIPAGKSGASIEDDSSDDDLGPAPPPADGSLPPSTSWEDIKWSEKPEDAPKQTLQREEWMLAPPSGADWATRIDPTKIKSRKFNTMKGAKGSSQSSSQGNSAVGGSWTETVEQKRKRLQDEVMGTKPASGSARDSADREKGRLRNEDEERETERRVREYNKAHRGSASLLEQHRTRDDAPQEDDPSKRAFDREKDIAGGAVSALQRRELLNKAKSMGSRFEKARYE